MDMRVSITKPSEGHKPAQTHGISIKDVATIDKALEVIREEFTPFFPKYKTLTEKQEESQKDVKDGEKKSKK